MELLYMGTSEKEKTFQFSDMTQTVWLLCIDGLDIDADLHGRLYFNFPAVLRADVLHK